MTDPSSAAILEQLQQPSSRKQLIAALKTLKNEVIGRPQSKRIWVELGVLEHVAIAASSGGRVTTQIQEQEQSGDDIESECIKLQALAVLGSLASGGLAYFPPTAITMVLPAMLSNLCSRSNSPCLVLAALRSLSAMADATLVSLITAEDHESFLSDALFAEESSEALCSILRQEVDVAGAAEQQVLVVESLIARLCSHERHRENLVRSGVLEALASRLARSIFAQGMALPRSALTNPQMLTVDELPSSQSTDIFGALEAMAAIIENSRHRASELAYSETLLETLPSAAHSSYGRGSRSHYTEADRCLNLIDHLVPQATSPFIPQISSRLSAFPPLGGQIEHNPSQPFSLEPSPDSPHVSGTTESPLIAYLIWLTRNSGGPLRLVSAQLLVQLHRAGMTAPYRKNDFGTLVVPLLVSLVDEGLMISTDNCGNDQKWLWFLQEQSSIVLAKLITDDEYLQGAAFNADAIPKLCKLLKTSYDPGQTLEKRIWSPKPDSMDSRQSSTPQPTSLLLPVVHKRKVREGALKAIAAITPSKEEYRKLVVAEGAMPFVVECLKPTPDLPSTKGENRQSIHLETGKSATIVPSPEYGNNPVSVLAPACAIVRHLSRSISTLRTTLVDYGVAIPLLALLQHKDIEVQIAATAALCNLVMELSPMRQTFADAGILRLLCNHAHAKDIRLRFNALWALKAFIHCADNETKKSCLEELGQDWLLQLISKDKSHSTSPSEDPLEDADEDNDVMMESVDIITEQPHVDQNAQAMDKHNGSARLNPPRPFRLLPQNLDSYHGRTSESDIGCQEQSLEFLRNIIGGFSDTATPANTDMIDFLFETYGEDHIFEILTDKLRPKPILQRNDILTNVAIPDVNRVSPQIAEPVAYILAHIAASVPRHRLAIMRHTELLRLVLDSLDYSSAELRKGVCHLVNNLTWPDNDDDRKAAAEIAQKLIEMGYLLKLKILRSKSIQNREDPDFDLDFNERAKTAVFQLEHYASL